jgi:opacity protein-like surface antigen
MRWVVRNVLLCSLLPVSAFAETDLIGGGAFLVGVPQGDFDKAVGTGYGLEGHAVITPAHRPYGLRVEGSFIIYGSETFTIPFPGTGGRVGLDETTDNWIGSLVLGPQLMARSGPVRPYVHALAGLAYVATTTEIRDENDFSSVASSTNYDDVGFRWSLGAGVAVPLGRSAALDLGAAYVGTESVRYLAEGDIHDDGHGGIQFTPRQSQVSLLQFRIGVTAGW